LWQIRHPEYPLMAQSNATCQILALDYNSYSKVPQDQRIR
jgi:hypothetical protein